MGDENSLQGRTQAHKHELDASTGGFLETGLTGMTNLSNGSLIMGNASEIQTELNAGNLNDTLQMGASTPQWVAPSVSTSAFKLEGTDTAPNSTTHSVTVTPATPLDETSAEIYLTVNGAMVNPQDMVFTINGLTSSGYSRMACYSESQAAFSFGLDTPASSFKLTNQKGEDWFKGQIHMSITEDRGGTMQVIGNYYMCNTGTEVANIWQGVIYRDSITSLSEFKLECGSGTSNYFRNGTTMSVYSLSKT